MKISGKIPITISPYFWLLAGLIGFVNTGNVFETAIWMCIVVVSVLVHEYGHALTALAFGQQARIELVSFGGLTHRHGPRLNAWKEFLVVLNGPLMGFALFVFTYFIAQALKGEESVFSYTVRITMAVNLFWTVMNLLPVQPLDGGKLMAIIFEGLLGVRGVKISLFLSIVLAVGLALLAFVYHVFLIGALFFIFAFESYRGWKSSLVLTDQDKDEELVKLLKQAESDFRGGREQDCLEKLKLLSIRSKGRGAIYIRATQLMAIIRSKSHDIKDLYGVLKPIEKDLDPKTISILQEAAFEEGYFQEALDIGTRLYQNSPTPQIAILNSRCCAKLGQVHPAIGWLKCAEREGEANLHLVIKQKDFDSVRSHDEFMSFVQEL